MRALVSSKATIMLSLIWIVIFVLSQVTNISSLLCGKGINVIEKEYWRYLTAGFVQTNLIHTLGNVYLIIWLGMKYENDIGSLRFFIIGFIGSTAAYLIFSLVYKQATSCIGGSGYWYALVGYILIQQLRVAEFPRVGQKWMLIYAFIFLPVIPIIPGMNISTTVFHGIALVLGVLMGFIIR